MSASADEIAFDGVGGRNHYRPFSIGGPFDEKIRPLFGGSELGRGHRRTQQPQPAG